ncbi:recombinase family protein [Bacillus cereus]|uniref:recombinase family protein n=1 Tax=Bacillus cereus TaxID=1396 RepID=UPI002ABED593|nr:recombinase family protein [Bacillus cereus]MDZ4508473.1 recombinase family protein [Bacillus cereus]
MKKAFMYLRKSIERESEKSIERQREEIEAYAEENKIEIVAEFSEVASSATIDREELTNMMEALRERSDIDYILVYSFDRISREVDGFGWLLIQLKQVFKVKTRIHSVTEVNDYEDDHYKLFFVMMRTFGATDERVRIVERLQGARQVKQQKGGFVGGTPPIGYKSLEGTGKLFIQENEVPIVQRIFDLRGKGLTMQRIADQLNTEGFKTRQGRDFKPMTVQRVLKNEDLYRGKGLVPKLLN